MKDALEIKWKEHSYLLKLGTIVLLDRPMPEIRNFNFEGKNVVQETSVFAGMIIDVNASNNQVWLYCAAYSKERAVIDSFARHGVTLMFERSDKWLVTPSMVADMLRLKPIKLIDSNGEHVRDLVPDNYFNFRIHLDIIKKALPMVGSDERIMNFFEWQTRIFKIMLSINGVLDPKTDSALSKRQFPIAEDISDFQKQIAAIKASEKFIPKKKPSAKAKSGGVAYTTSSVGFSSRYAYTPRITANNSNAVTLNRIPYTRNESITAAAVNGRYTTGHVGGFDAVDINPELFVTDPGHNRMEVYLEQRSDRPAVDTLSIWGSILCIAGTPCIIMIDPHWNLSSTLDRAVYSVEVYADGQTLRLRGLPIDEINDAASSVYQLIGIKWPNRLNQSQQAIQTTQPTYGTDLPVIKLRDNLVKLTNGATLLIEIGGINSSMANGLGQPGSNIVLINDLGRAHEVSYLVVDNSFLGNEYCRSNHTKYYRVSFTSHGDVLALDTVYYIEYSSSNREELIEYLVANHRFPRQEPEEVATAYDPSREPVSESTRSRAGEIEFTLCDSVLAFSIIQKTMLVDFDHMPPLAASKITAFGTIFAVKNRETDRIESKWQVVANDDEHNWTMTFKSEYRNPDLNGATLCLRKLSENEATSGRRYRSEPDRRPRHEARGGIVIPEPRFVEPPTIGAQPAEITPLSVTESFNYVVQSTPRWSQEMYINGNWPSEPLSNEPVQNAASFWSQNQQISTEPQPIPTSVNGQVGGYQYNINSDDVVFVTISGIDYEISVRGFGITNGTGSSVGEISVRYRLSSSTSDYSDPFQTRWNSIDGWFVPTTGLRLVATARDLANFLDVFYGTGVSTHASQPVAAIDTLT